MIYFILLIATVWIWIPLMYGAIVGVFVVNLFLNLRASFGSKGK